MIDLDFDDHNTLYATHGLHAFAAKCPPPLVGYALKEYTQPGELVVDPMVGSGTTLVEARLLGRNALGYDIDPLAQLIARVKSRVVDDSKVGVAFERVCAHVEQDLGALTQIDPPSVVMERATPPAFPNRDYWFEPEVSKALALLSFHIAHVLCTQDVREFLWVAFSSLILARTSVANARDIIHSRHHHITHAETPDVMSRFHLRVKQMRRQMLEFKAQCERAPLQSWTRANAGSARSIPLRSASVDLVFTSPPYATALDYPRAHFLAIPWMYAATKTDFTAYRQKAPQYIGSQNGKLAEEFALDARLVKLESAASSLTEVAVQSARQAKLCQRYFLDMYGVLGEIARIVKAGKHAVIVVCPSNIRKVAVPTHTVFAEMGERLGLQLKEELTRSISTKRRVLPYMVDTFGPRMDTEYVLILRKV
ncbi:MAG: DNA methyltransferase [Caldilineaceae bacterium]